MAFFLELTGSLKMNFYQKISQLNWQKGLHRLWAVFSSFWFIGFIIAGTISYLSDIKAQSYNTGGMFDDLIPQEQYISPSAQTVELFIIGIAIPLVLYVFFQCFIFLAGWIYRGFMSSNTPSFNQKEGSL